MPAPARRLAAILFADIQGYTALMQRDEKQAFRTLNKYQQTLKKLVDESNGDVIKNYGDGSLCLFSTALDALVCAKQLQTKMIKDPIVPLRIGLHLGDVTYQEGDVYGDAINLASRIESMGIAGNVLMSRSFHSKIKNQRQFLFENLGWPMGVEGTISPTVHLTKENFKMEGFLAMV